MKKACSHFLSRGSIKIIHIDIIFNESISMIMIDAVRCEMRNYQNSDDIYNLILET